MKLTKQDNDAINHIASVSKHKHAELIAKWLITGWKVEFKNTLSEWFRTPDPEWDKGTEYRLIEPKPPKPAYRVFSVGAITGTVDRYEDGTYSTNYHKDREWLSDWIEYDPESTPKKWPTPLVERIAVIDTKAAEWILDHWDDLLDDRYTLAGLYLRDSDRLDKMFLWNKSDQGKSFWYSISKQLGE